jgi:hypothetical protein
MENFFGGVTTAHGINQVFKEYNGPLRRLFWLGAFGGCFFALIFFIGDAITAFLGASTASVVSTGSHSGDLPMVTVCNLSPVRCGCSAFYDPAVLASPAALAAVLPFVCAPLVAFKPGAWQTIDAAGRVTAFSLLEDASQHVDLSATQARMAAFAGAINCDSGNYTAVVLAAALVAGRATYHDLYSYAGYSARDKLIRGCMATDSAAGSPTLGRRVPCQGDAWWARPGFDPELGACHTFNPCHGFPVDALCGSDADCAHPAAPLRPGGRCTAGRCECTRCAAGAGCRVARQGTAGRGRGVRLVSNVGTDQVRAHSGLTETPHTHTRTHQPTHPPTQTTPHTHPPSHPPTSTHLPTHPSIHPSTHAPTHQTLPLSVPSLCLIHAHYRSLASSLSLSLSLSLSALSLSLSVSVSLLPLHLLSHCLSLSRIVSGSGHGLRPGVISVYIYV